MGEVFLDALIDTLWVLPFLLVMNFLIELIEYGSKGLKANRILKGPAAPLIGTAVGVVPQCGFSVVATELYSKRRIALGTLLAVYLATSDEALPILLSSITVEPNSWIKVLTVIIIKVCFALVVGYAAFGVEKLIAYKRSKTASAPAPVESPAPESEQPVSPETAGENADAAHADSEAAEAHAHADTAVDDGRDHSHTHADADDDADVHIHGCHHHALEEKREISDGAGKKQKAAHIWNVYLKHPLIHTATVVLYIFIVNVVFNTIVHCVGRERLAEFVRSTGYLQPVLAALVGLIPNCAGSVVITEMYVVGGLNLGGAVAGLCVSAGIGYAVLAKQNRPIKQTVGIISTMYVLSVVLGLCITACGF